MPRTLTISTQRGGKNIAQTLRAPAPLAQMPVFTTANVEDRNLLMRSLTTMSDVLRKAVVTAYSNPLSGGILLTNIALQAGVTTQIPHLLGRVPIGWLVVRSKDAAFSGYEVDPTAPLSTSNYLAIHSANTSTVDLLVF